MAGSEFSAAEGPGGRASSFLDDVVAFVVAFVVAIFHPIFHLLVSVISPAKSRDQQHQRQKGQSQSQTTQKDTKNSRSRNNKNNKNNNSNHLSASDNKQLKERDDVSTTTSHDGDLTTNTGHTLKRMAPPLQNQPSAAKRSSQPMMVKTNGQLPVKVALPRMGPTKGSVNQENVPANGSAVNKGPVVANVTKTGRKYRTADEEQAQENRQDQLTLPPLEAEPRIMEEDEVNKDDDATDDPANAAERAYHHSFMDQALDMARLSLKTNETPVGCVLVHNGRVVARGMNATNITRNGTRHAELMALTALLSYTPNSDVEEKAQDKVQAKAADTKKPKRKSKNKRPDQETDAPTLAMAYTEQDWGDIDPKDGHIYPYGQKLHPAPRVDRSLITECTLYVTVEPCVMCASMLRQFGIKKVYFGAVNDKFGGTGGVFCIHMNSDPAHAVSVPATPLHRPVANQLPRPALPHKPASCASSINGSQDDSAVNGGEVKSVNSITFVEPPVPVSNMSMGHGGNVEKGFDAEGGWGRDEAVNLLRQFYVQENGRAPVPRKKEGRAARLAAMMESQGMTTEGTALAGLLQQERETLEREKAVAEGNGSADPTAEVEADLVGGPARETAESGQTTLEGAEPNSNDMRDVVAV